MTNDDDTAPPTSARRGGWVVEHYGFADADASPRPRPAARPSSRRLWLRTAVATALLAAGAVAGTGTVAATHATAAGGPEAGARPHPPEVVVQHRHDGPT